MPKGRWVLTSPNPKRFFGRDVKSGPFFFQNGTNGFRKFQEPTTGLANFNKFYELRTLW